MEAKLRGETHRFYNPGGQQFLLRGGKNNLNGEKRNFEWDLNDWAWDSDLFIASPLNSSIQADCRSRQLFPVGQQIQVAGGSSNSSSSCSDENNQVHEKERRDLEKRRRAVVWEDERNLTLKLGGHGYPNTESDNVNSDEKNGKKSKISSVVPINRATCQVENCVADLSMAKDYHRRHKVCEMHSKASKALVGNVLQRFCQQCSRFHVLQEFDEGKRSCRRRLAGHNRRRRKTHPEANVNGATTVDDRSSNYLLISLLRILSNMHSNNSDQAKDQDFLSHLLRNLAGHEGVTDGRNVSGVIRESKEVASADDNVGASSDPRLITNGHETSRNLGSTSQRNKFVDAQGPQVKTLNPSWNSPPGVSVTVNNSPDGVVQTLPFRRLDCPAKALTSESAEGRTILNNFDLNNVYNDSQDYEVHENAQLCENIGSGYPDLPSWMQKSSQQSSPPQTSVNSDSLSGQSLSSSSGDAQSRTDRIVFKLFGKDPNHFPASLRSQILNWLSHSPTDIEGYIRPGCIILTIYLRLAESTWQELQDDLSSNLSRLLDVSDDDFWKTGWVYTRVQHQIAFIYNGQVVVDKALPVTSHNRSRITSVTPIAVSLSERAQFLVKGYNLSRPTARLLCALEGKYLLQQATSECALEEQNEVQCLGFPCTVPAVAGRGFLEVEDDGLSSGFYPFIVAEQDVCLEIRMLESTVEVSEFSKLGGAKKNQALDFLHEMGWLLHRSRLGRNNSATFSFMRFRWLMEFSIDHGWVAVVKKLLDVLFDGCVGSGEHSCVELSLLDICLLHRAVRKRSRPMVELLLKYEGSKNNYLFKPDATGPAGLTPLHIAASSDGSESLVDALTNDPGLVGVSAWKAARDNTGLSPEDYARMRGHYTYIHLIHNKTKQLTGHMIVDIPADYNSSSKQQTKLAGFQISKAAAEKRPVKMQSCGVCDQQVGYGSRRRSLVYRPALLSMLAIAAVCVCVSLFFKSSPEVRFVYAFRWEKLLYGPE